MAKKIVKKRKLKVLNLLIVLLVFIGLFFAVQFGVKIPVKNIIIKNTSYLNDDYIIELAGIKNYPSFILTRSKEIEEKLKNSSYIDQAKLKKKYGFVFELNIVENRALFYDTNIGKYVFDNQDTIGDEEVNYIFRVPSLLNYVADGRY